MKQPIKKGIPTKQNIASKNEYHEILGNQPSLTDIPSNCKKELEEKGLEARWLDIVELKKNQGFHKRGWQPYKFDCMSGAKNNPFASNDGQFDGYLLRNQMVLGIKTKEEAKKRKDYVRMKTQLQSNPVEMQKASLKEFIGDKGKVSGVEDTDQDSDN